MPVRDTFRPGQFCWIDLTAHDLPAAKAWYGALFGWTAVTQDTGGGPPYEFFVQGDLPVAAVGQMNDEMKAQGIPPTWNSYVAVEDCAASEARASALGGSVICPTMEIPGHGKLCFLADPSGAVFALWQQVAEGPGVRVAEHGALSWNELMTRDVTAARRFYGDLFGWGYRELDMGGTAYTVFSVDGEDAGGMMAMDGPQFEGVPEHWMVYLQVDDCAATAAAVGESGGTVLVPPTDIPVGTFAMVQDPQGGAFSLMQMAAEPTC